MPASVARAIYLTDVTINAKCCYVSIFWSYRAWITLPIAPKPCFTLVCLNAPCHFTPLLTIRPLIFGLTLFGWFISIYLSLSYRNIIFDLRSLFQEHDYGVKQKPFLMSILTGFSYVSQSPLPSAEVKISGGIPLLPLYAFTAWTGATLPSAFLMRFRSSLHANAKNNGVKMRNNLLRPHPYRSANLGLHFLPLHAT